MKVPWRRQAAPSPSPRPNLDSASPTLLAWAEAVDASQLSDKTVKQAERYLRDHAHLNLQARREFDYRMRSVITAEVSPPPPASIATLDVIAVALSARRKQLGIG
jgi:hypothetical protein